MKSNLVSDRLPGFRPAPPRSVTLTAYGPDSVVEVLRVAIGAQGSVIGVYNERKDAQSNLWRSLLFCRGPKFENDGIAPCYLDI